MRSLRLVLFLFAILLGIAAGLYYAWIINPLKPGATTPDALRPDYRADVALMVAEVFQVEGNTARAAQRLAIFGNESPARIVQQAILTGRELGFSSRDIDLLARLSQALLEQPTPARGATP